MRKYIYTLLSLSALLFNTQCFSQGTNSTFNIDDYSWLQGQWSGEAFGGTFEEVWSKGSAEGTMMGMYKQINDGKTVFYEFFILDKDGIKLKHFNPDLTGWEEKKEIIKFPMLQFTTQKITMDGYEMEKVSDTDYRVTLKIENNGEIETHVFEMAKSTK